MSLRLSLMWLSILLAGCQQENTTDPVEKTWVPEILESRYHDSNAFTQGLLIDGDFWLESTGLYGKSELREVERDTGRVRRRVRLPNEVFGEGLALLHGKLYQLTWRAGICYQYDRESFQRIGKFQYQGEGWGICSNGEKLFMSNGGSWISVRDPATFDETGRFEVVGEDGPIVWLNELEWVNGELWANVFQTKRIVRVNPTNGSVIGWIELRELPFSDHRHQKQDVLNGIAWDRDADSVWLTGKNWKALYRIPVPGN